MNYFTEQFRKRAKIFGLYVRERKGSDLKEDLFIIRDQFFTEVFELKNKLNIILELND